MSTVSIHFSEDVEEKWLHVEVQRLVIQEQLGQQTHILGVNLCETMLKEQVRKQFFMVVAQHTVQKELREGVMVAAKPSGYRFGYGRLFKDSGHYW